ncbi:MAG: class I SAM-dependent methyltransferase [Byssovorax sp.]
MGDRRNERKARKTRSKDRELLAGTSAHYVDPAYYTKTYRGRVEDVRYYVELAAERGGPVLELGCGNGRITIPLGRAGVETWGVDLSPEMLADLRRRLKDEPPEVRARVHVQRGDMRRARTGRRFPLIFCPFNALLHLYTRDDVERFLAGAREQLTPRGELVFDVSMPEPSELARDPGRAYHAPRFRYPDPPGEGTMVRYTERFDYDKVRQILFVAMEFMPMNGGESWMTPLAHRQFYPQELEALLHYNGFTITAQHGDFFRGPLTPSSATILIHARARKR